MRLVKRQRRHSPIPRPRPNRRTRADFARFSGESRTSQTAWRMAQSAANHSLHPNSLLCRENTGNLAVLGPHRDGCAPKSARSTRAFAANSLRNGTGNFKGRTGNSFCGSGNFQGGGGKPKRLSVEPQRSGVFAPLGVLTKHRSPAIEQQSAPSLSYLRPRN